MCGTCGCNATEIITMATHEHIENHQHEFISIEQDLLGKNRSYAEINRKFFIENKILALNFMSSPGAGKTTLLEKTITAMQVKYSFAVIEGDQQTSLDAERIAKTGASVIQINTGKSCHLDAHQTGHALEKLHLRKNSILLIENVGNLICPALFDLGENYRIAVMSVTEGDDKPLKYPDMFALADLMIINKIDLLPYVNFNVEQCIQYAKQVNRNIETICLSATQDRQIENWYHWIRDHHEY